MVSFSAVAKKLGLFFLGLFLCSFVPSIHSFLTAITRTLSNQNLRAPTTPVLPSSQSHSRSPYSIFFQGIYELFFL